MKKNSEKPNFTAWFVLQSLLAAMHQPEFAGEPHKEALYLRKILAHAAADHRFLSRIIANLPYSAQYRVAKWVTDSARPRHFMLRKQAIERQARALLSEGKITQIVVLGSGFDVLSMVLAKEFPAVNFIEVDVAATQQFKQSVYRRHEVRLPENVELISGDLVNPLAQVLSVSKLFKAERPTLWLAEGLLMFLPEDAVRQLFSAIREISAEHSYAIFTTLAPKIQGSKFGSVVQKVYLKKEKSPFKWCIDSSDVALFVQPLGFAMSEHIPYRQLHQPYAKPSEIGKTGEESISVAAVI